MPLIAVDLLPASMTAPPAASVLLLLAFAALAILVAGLARRPTWSTEVLLDTAAQRFNPALALILAVICPCMIAGSIDGTATIIAQQGPVWRWMVFRDPCNFLALLLFGCAVWMLFHQPTGAAKSAGLTAIAQRAALIALAALATTLWLGGWHDPAGLLNTTHPSAWTCIAGAIMFAGKCVALLWAGHVGQRVLAHSPAPSTPCPAPRCAWILLTTAAINVVVGATYAWLVEPLAAFQKFMHGALTVIGGCALLAAAAFIGWTFRARPAKPSNPPLHP